jgi:hypothetical protein
MSDDTTLQPEDCNLSRRHLEKFVLCKLDVFMFIASWAQTDIDKVKEFAKLWKGGDDPWGTADVANMMTRYKYK